MTLLSVWVILTDDFYLGLINGLKYSHELIPLATVIFLFGLLGFIESREFLSLLVNTEIMMLGANFHLITSSVV
jgi:NADH:ubiquinone oxidoreductase subunit K